MHWLWLNASGRGGSGAKAPPLAARPFKFRPLPASKETLPSKPIVALSKWRASGVAA